jgi:hypothetical protein
VHTLMQATLHKFTLERIERDGWQGSLYEVSRLDVLATHGFVAAAAVPAGRRRLRRPRRPAGRVPARGPARLLASCARRRREARFHAAARGGEPMCGRYTLYHDEEDLTELFALDAFPWSPRYNIAPTQVVPIVRERADGVRERLDARWGLVPAWVKEPTTFKALLFNARSETVGEKPAFRDAARRARCALPASGFFEWRSDPAGGAKQPYFVHRRDGAPMALAGLYAERAQRPAARRC